MGGAVSDREFLVRLADRGVEVHLMLPADLPHANHPNFVVHFYGHRLRQIPYFRYVLRDLDVFIDMRKLLKSLSAVRWIRFSSPYRNGLGAWAAKRRDNRLWGSFHHFENRVWFNAVDRWLPAKCDLVTVVSEASRRDLLDRCPRMDPQKVAVVYNGVDTERNCPNPAIREQARQELGLQPHEVGILFAGRLIRRKGISDLVAVWANLQNRSNARLVIVGTPSADDGPLARSVTQLAQSDQRVIYRERVPNLADIMRACDIFLFPTHLEGFGLVVAEALASGLPVVTTQAKGVSEVVDPACAFQAGIGNVQELTSFVLRLLEDSALRSQMGVAGRNRVQAAFNWDHQITRLLERLGAE
jgi:glycosyltransferase involved in cell wall biosynthesis